MDQNGLTSSFIDYLVALKSREDRRKLAVLKRAISFPPGTYIRAFPIIEPWVRSIVSKERELFYLVASLFALHRGGHSDKQTFPEVIGRYVASQKGSKTIENRFLALLDASDDELNVMLRRLVAIVDEQSFDWKNLLSHLRFWYHPDKFVQMRWARKFYEVKEDSEKKGGEEE